MVWKRLIVWMNMLVFGFSIFMALELPGGMLPILFVLTLTSSSLGILVIAAMISAGEHPFGPPMLKIVAAIAAAMNLFLGIFGAVGLTRTNLSPSTSIGLLVLAISALNLSFLAAHSKTLRASGFSKAD